MELVHLLLLTTDHVEPMSHQFWCLMQKQGTLNNHFLVGGFNSFEKYAHQIGSSPQVGVKMKHIWNHLSFFTSKPSLVENENAGMF